MSKWKKAYLLEVVDLTKNTCEFYWKIEQKDASHFVPGQFITFDLPISDKRLERWRSYSIAGAPNDDGLVKLCIVLFSDGRGSEYLFSLEPGAEIAYKGPSGVFVLPSQISSPLCFICTGTGVAPFKSMIEYLDIHHWPDVDIALYFGCRSEGDILYREYFEELAARRPSFHYAVATSRETFNAYRGYVHGLYEARYKGKEVDNTRFYLCGWQKMIDEAVERLGNMGVNKKNIIYELYG